MQFLAAEHFVRAPEWLWFILLYFFFAGLAGGSYVLATMLRLVGDVRDEPAARVGFLVSFPLTLVCPVLLTADLGASWSRFWHMLIDVTPGETGPILHYWSPMSLGAWALLVFGFFSFVSFVDALLFERRGRSVLPDALGNAFSVVGSLFGLFVASYTGVLLSVSNQPVWSDTWTLSGLFLASGLSGSAALIMLLVRYRPEAAYSVERLRLADAYFSVLELVLVLAFFVTIAIAGALTRVLVPWFPLWILVALGIGASLLGFRPARFRPAGGGEGVAVIRRETAVIAVLVLIAVLAMRAAVIFSAQ